ncbi:MAG: hypothetical protein K0R36_3544 [Chryseobacterium sp.]|jgi:hypothetical protein|nr:hypothetical protein [Chryseobacterium sp.]
MKQKIYSILAITIFAFIIVGVLFWSSLKKEQKIEFLTERNIINLKKADAIDLKDNFSQMRFYNDELFFVSYEDGNQGKLYKFDSKTKKINLFKDFNQYNKQGEKNIIGEYYIKNENDSLKYFYKNNGNNSFRSIYNDQLLYEKEFKIMIQRIFYHDDENSIVTTWNPSFEPEYYRYNIKKQEFSRIKFDYNLIKNIKFQGVALDGIFSSNNNQIFLTSYAQNLVFLFDKQFNYTGHFTLNYKNPTFNILHTKEKSVPVIDPNNRLPNISVDVDDQYYYVLTNEKGDREGPGTYFVDRYNLIDKKYNQSIKIEVKENNLAPKEIRINKNKLYILTKKNMTVYEKDRF